MLKQHLIILCLTVVLTTIKCTTSASIPTAKTCIFAYFCDTLDSVEIDSLAKKFNLIILHDSKRSAIPRLRALGLLHLKRQPLIFIFKDCMTLTGPGNPWKSIGDSLAGGGASLGGFWHFDSIFRGLGYKADTFFLMASEKTKHFDASGRVKAGGARYWKYRWAMDWGREYWARVFACSTKIQCLRNYSNKTFDNTFFDGIFIDNVLHFNREYSIFSKQYWDIDNPMESNLRLQDAISRFLEITYVEYKNNRTPDGNPCMILSIGNTNKAYWQNGLWERCLQYLDGGMEEFFAQTWQDWQSFNDWKKMISEVQYAESTGKLCLVRTRIDTFEWKSLDDPLSVISYDTTQMMFGFTSYLMGMDSTTYFSFQGDYQHIFWAPILDIDIGKSKGPYIIREDSIAFRVFEKGLVYCNPSSIEKNIYIPKERFYMVRASGDTISVSNIVLDPYYGILLKLRE